MGIFGENLHARLTCICSHSYSDHKKLTLIVFKIKNLGACEKCNCIKFKQQEHGKFLGKY